MNLNGGDEIKRYIIESSGSGVALLDYDDDGLTDIFLVNGTRLSGLPPGPPPTNHLYRNQGNLKFVDVTESAGLSSTGWGQGVCSGDYDNDGFEDLFVTYYGSNRLYRNTSKGSFQDVTHAAGLAMGNHNWSTGCAFLDYDRDGWLDLFVANYVDFDISRDPEPGANPFCFWKGVPVFCGPRGLGGQSNHRAARRRRRQTGEGGAAGDYHSLFPQRRDPPRRLPRKVGGLSARRSKRLRLCCPINGCSFCGFGATDS